MGLRHENENDRLDNLAEGTKYCQTLPLAASRLPNVAAILSGMRLPMPDRLACVAGNSWHAS